MQLTLIGLVVFLVGCFLLLARRLEAVFAFTLICTLMGGSAAVIVTALGSASISPGHLALGFLFLRVLLRRSGEKLASAAIRGNAAFIAFTAYAAASAIALPRIFRNAMDVVPMRPAGLRSLYDAFPLAPSSQNVTTSVYIVGSLLAGICSYIAVRQRRGAVVLVQSACAIVCLHAVFGILSAVAGDTFVGTVLAFFRNGSYAQVEQSVGGYVRIAGIMPEASTYAGYSIGWLVFMTELWLRDVMPKRTGILSGLLTLVLVCSTSSTAYVCLAIYGIILAMRMVVFPQSFRFRKVLWMGGFLFILTIISALTLVFNPTLAQSLLDILKRLTVDKATSNSGLQRSFWAKQGWNAFQTSHGLGIGAGSFRSSSFVTAVIGSTGIIGATTFLAYLALVFKPVRASTFFRSIDPVDAVGVAASWAAIMTILPQAVSGPSPDPGLSFAILASCALGLRSARKPAPTLSPNSKAIRDGVEPSPLHGPVLR